MNVSDDDRMLRRLLLTTFLTTLVLTAGCSGVLSDSPGSGTATPATESDRSGASPPLTPVDGNDLRSVEIPDTGSTTVSGELDGSDPARENSVYEPIQFEAEAGTLVNITMETDEGEPMLRLRNLNGTVVDTARNGAPGTAEFTEVSLGQTGRYTVEATSTTPNSTFEYTLTIERSGNELFAGPQSTWNETERYLEFGRDFSDAADQATNNGRFTTHVSNRTIWANATGNYVVVTYAIDSNINNTQWIEIDTALLVAYTNGDQVYQNLGENESYAENEEWVPDIIFLRALNPEGRLYRTNFVTTEWAREYNETDDVGSYAGRYYSTERYGPAHPRYNSSGGEISTTNAEFPLETYDDYLFENGTAFSEIYGSE